MTGPNRFANVRLQWGYQLKRYQRLRCYHNEIVIPTMASFHPPYMKGNDCVIPRDFATHLHRELSRILSEPGTNV